MADVYTGEEGNEMDWISTIEVGEDPLIDVFDEGIISTVDAVNGELVWEAITMDIVWERLESDRIDSPRSSSIRYLCFHRGFCSEFGRKWKSLLNNIIRLGET